jgi:XisI protein
MGMETYTVFDTVYDHCQVVSVGWEGSQRLYGCLIHVDIKDEKIWIQYDGTEYSIAQELINSGVSPQSIVVAYHAPYARKFTKFAVG